MENVVSVVPANVIAVIKSDIEQSKEQRSVYQKGETIWKQVEASPVDADGKYDSDSRLMKLNIPNEDIKISLGRGVSNTLGTYSVARVKAKRAMSGTIGNRPFEIKEGWTALKLYPAEA